MMLTVVTIDPPAAAEPALAPGVEAAVDTRPSARGRDRFDRVRKTLLIINDPPYGNERVYNALRLAGGLVRQDGHHVAVFLMGDAVTGAKAGQKTPNGYYNIERMVRSVIMGRGEVLLCGSCLDARGIADAELVAGTQRSSMDALCEATLAADKVLVF